MLIDKNVVAIIQARNGSSRLPEKVLKSLAGKPLIYHICNRLKASLYIKQIVIATTENQRDDSLYNFADQHNIKCFRGSEENVLSRYYFAAREAKAEIIVRITADDPFKDSSIIDKVIELLYKENLDFAFNNFPPSFPEGLDVEVFTLNAIKNAFDNAKDPFEKEHVTQYFYRNADLFKTTNYSYKENLSYLRLTVDTPNDFKLAEEIYKRLYKENEVFGFKEILDLLHEEPELFEINLNEKRSELYKKINTN